MAGLTYVALHGVAILVEGVKIDDEERKP